VGTRLETVRTGTASSLFGTASVQNFEFELKNEKFAKKPLKILLVATDVML
jgi:hypothetical protein